MGKRTDLKILTAALDPNPCLRVRCTHRIRIWRNRARKWYSWSTYYSAILYAADYEHHECQGFTEFNISAVYTGIKNLNLSRIQVFRWKLLGNFP